MNERFKSKYTVSADGCWLWTASTNRGGYGLFVADGKLQTAHRYAWKSANGPIADGMCVCHKCDRPAHLFLGTHAENVADKVSKGRQTRGYDHIKDRARGARHGSAKLTEDDVLAIRSDTRTQAQIAAVYGVTEPNVWAVLHRKTWKHV